MYIVKKTTCTLLIWGLFLQPIEAFSFWHNNVNSDSTQSKYGFVAFSAVVVSVGFACYKYFTLKRPLMRSRQNCNNKKTQNNTLISLNQSICSDNSRLMLQLHEQQLVAKEALSTLIAVRAELQQAINLSMDLRNQLGVANSAKVLLEAQIKALKQKEDLTVNDEREVKERGDNSYPTLRDFQKYHLPILIQRM